MIEWIKPNGNKITTNEEKATVEYCESLGWERAKKKPGPKPKNSDDKE